MRALVWTAAASTMLLTTACGKVPESGATGKSGEAALAPEQARPQRAGFIPADFQPPVMVEGDEFILKPLGPEVMEIDFKAYMSSIEHLQKTFTRSTSWPREGLTLQDAVEDMANEKRRFETRESFAYAVLTPDGTRERGCVYLRPSSKTGYDAEVEMWVTKAEFDVGFDKTLYDWTTRWMEKTWPFENVAYPGRSIAWDSWEGMAAKSD